MALLQVNELGWQTGNPDRGRKPNCWPFKAKLADRQPIDNQIVDRQPIDNRIVDWQPKLGTNLVQPEVPHTI